MYPLFPEFRHAWPSCFRTPCAPEFQSLAPRPIYEWPHRTYSYLIRDTGPFGQEFAEKRSHMMERMKVTAKFAERRFQIAGTLMHVRTQSQFARCAAETLSANMNIPFPADNPFFRRGIPARSIDFQDCESRVESRRLMRLVHSCHRVPSRAKLTARHRSPGGSMAVEAVCQIADRPQFGQARGAMLVS